MNVWKSESNVLRTTPRKPINSANILLAETLAPTTSLAREMKQAYFSKLSFVEGSSVKSFFGSDR